MKLQSNKQTAHSYNGAMVKAHRLLDRATDKETKYMAKTAQELLNDMAAFDKQQLEWYKGQIQWYTEEKAFVTKQIAREHEKDMELVEYIYSKGPVTAMDSKLFNKKYESTETKKLKAERRHIRRQIKKYEKWLAYYTKRVEENR